MRVALARVPTLVDGRFLVAIAAHETTFHKREEVVGRSGGGGAKPQTAPGVVSMRGRAILALVVLAVAGPARAGPTMGAEAYQELERGVLRSFTWEKGATALGVLVGFVVVAKLIGYLLRRYLVRRGKAGGATFALSKLLTYLLVFAGALAALGFLGIPMGSMLLTSSALLVGLGFSLQHVAQDFVAGIVILVEQSIRRNDFVTFGDTRGTVVEIGLRSTQLLTRDGTTLMVPNHLLTSSEVSNHSSPHERARLHVNVPVGFRESVDHVRETLLGVAEASRI